MTDETDRLETSGNRWEPEAGAVDPAPDDSAVHDAEPAPTGDDQPRRRLVDRLEALPRSTTRAAAAAAAVLLVTGVGGAGFALGRATGHHDGFRDGFPGPRDAGFGPGGSERDGDGVPPGAPQGDDPQGGNQSGTALSSAPTAWYVVPSPARGPA